MADKTAETILSPTKTTETPTEMVETPTETILSPTKLPSFYEAVTPIARRLAVCIIAADKKLSTEPFSYETYYITNNACAPHIPKLQDKIYNFFAFINHQMHITYGELVCACKYTEQYIASRVAAQVPIEPIIGTVLACAVSLAQKYARDVPYNARFFGTILKISTTTFALSEFAFSVDINWKFFIDETEFIRMETVLFGKSYCIRFPM